MKGSIRSVILVFTLTTSFFAMSQHPQKVEKVQASKKSMPDDLIVTDKNGDRHTLKEYAKKRPLLIYRFRETDCNVCYEAHIEMLKKNNFFRHTNDILFMAGFSNPRFVGLYSKAQHLPADLNMVSVGVLPFDNIHEPYFVWINADLKVVDVYSPGPNMKVVGEQLKRRINLFLK